MKRLLVIVAFATIAMLGWWVFAERSSLESQAARAAVASANRPGLGAALASAIALKEWGGDPRAAAVASMRNDYEPAEDLHAFFDHALQDPHRAGVYYAKRTYFDCLGATGVRRNFPEPSDEIHDAAQRGRASAEMEGAIDRCNGLYSPDSSARLIAAMKASTDDGDPEMGPWEAHLQGVVGKGTRTRFDLAMDMLQRALALGDPYDLLDAMHKVDLDAGWFDDVTRDRQKRERLDRVALIVHCDLGARCSGDITAVIRCYEGAGCDGSLAAVALQDPADSSAVRYALVQQAADLVNAAREGTLMGRYIR